MPQIHQEWFCQRLRENKEDCVWYMSVFQQLASVATVFKRMNEKDYCYCLHLKGGRADRCN